MKKDIVKVVIAFSFIALSFISSAYITDIKEKSKYKSEKGRKQEYVKKYENESSTYEFNLPLIIVDTNGKDISSNEKVYSQIQVYDKNNSNYLSDEPTLTSTAKIKIRGNTTRYFPKKQYSLDLINKKGNERDEKLLSMNKESDWVLNGPFSDKSLMRNYIVFKSSKNIMEFVPDVKFCEVFVIDDNSDKIQKKHYKGVYVLIEKIKRNEDRVDIVKSQDNTFETSFIIAKDRNKNEDIFISTYGKETYIYDYAINIEYPKFDLTPQKYEYIKKYISEFERILYSDKYNDPLTGYSKYIDIDSFVDYYVINEFFFNTDAGTLSTYFYKDYNEKMKAGPIWDFNRSLGNNAIREKNAFEHKGFFMNERSWFSRLIEDKKFSDKVINRYKELRKTYLSDEYLIKLIDETRLYLGDAIGRNFHIWPIHISNQDDMIKENGELFKQYENDPDKFKSVLENNKDLFKSTRGKAKTYEEEIYLMKNFIVQRGKWMDENIDTLNKWAS